MMSLLERELALAVLAGRACPRCGVPRSACDALGGFTRLLRSVHGTVIDPDVRAQWHDALYHARGIAYAGSYRSSRLCAPHLFSTGPEGGASWSPAPEGLAREVAASALAGERVCLNCGLPASACYGLYAVALFGARITTNLGEARYYDRRLRGLADPPLWVCCWSGISGALSPEAAGVLDGGD